MEEQERYQRIRQDIRERAGAIRAELAAAVARVDEHDVRLDGHGRRLDRHDEQLGALEAKVGAMADVHVRAHQAEGLPVPDALRPESPLRLVGDGR